MPKVVEPEWIDMSRVGCSFEEQIDANSQPTACRHRIRSFTGEIEHEWIDGPAPMVVGEPLSFVSIFPPSREIVSLVGKAVVVKITKFGLGSTVRRTVTVTVDGEPLLGVIETNTTDMETEIKTEDGKIYLAPAYSVSMEWEE